MKPIGLTSDHAGYKLKEFVKTVLDKEKIPYIDFGTNSENSCSYSDYAHILARAVENGEVYPGIGICGSGNGINMALNKHQGIRSALCWTEEISHLARAHNDANVLAIPGRFVTNEEAERIVLTFLSTPFEGGRHQERINHIPL